jgi:flagellar protein FlaI
MLNPMAAGLLSFLIDGSVSMLVAGGRGSGKTSVLGALMLEILPKTRQVTLEDTLELPVEQLRDLNYNIERLKTRSVITKVTTEMPAEEALRTALRLGDSALIVGEVRSSEAKALYEAMRIGALSNVVAGTIHGESAFGVFDRVVNDLGVPKTSFKATDIIPICKSLRSSDGMHRFRRMTEITEVRKNWSTDPQKEDGFVNLMEYSGKKDELVPTDTFKNGESEVLNRIASYVKEWSGNWEAVWDNITARARMKGELVELARKLNRPEVMEAEWVITANNIFHVLSEQLRNETGTPDSNEIFKRWQDRIKKDLKI